MSDHPRTAIDVRHVSRVYATRSTGRVVALDDVSLAIPHGAFVSVIGPSGCGKSTLLRAVAGLEAPDRGTVTIHGVSPDEAGMAKMLGFVPQTPALLPWRSVLANVTMPTRVNRAASARRPDIERSAGWDVPRDAPDMVELLRRAGLGDVMHKLPHQISGGMRQRAAIVRAFGLQPDVLLMDEPFSALDEFTREAMQGQLLDLWDEMKSTVLFVTHSVPEAVRLSDVVVVMAPRPGRVTDVVEIDLPRPRSQTLLGDARFHAYEDLIRDRLRTAWNTAA